MVSRFPSQFSEYWQEKGLGFAGTGASHDHQVFFIIQNAA